MNVDPRRGTLRPAWLALAVGLVPIVAVHTAYFIAAAEQRVEWCIPYLQGCTSISKAARFGLANHLFKAMMLPVAAAMALFWMYATAWVETLHPQRLRRLPAMRVLGVIASLFLVLYAAFLGVEGEFYQWLRRYGITVYFAFTVLAQMLLASALPGDSHDAGLRRDLIGLCAVMLVLGIASIPLQHLLPDRDAAVNAIEWIYALLMTGVFVRIGVHWARHGLRLRIVNEGGS